MNDTLAIRSKFLYLLGANFFIVPKLNFSKLGKPACVKSAFAEHARDRSACYGSLDDQTQKRYCLSKLTRFLSAALILFMVGGTFVDIFSVKYRITHLLLTWKVSFILVDAVSCTFVLFSVYQTKKHKETWFKFIRLINMVYNTSENKCYNTFEKILFLLKLILTHILLVYPPISFIYLLVIKLNMNSYILFVTTTMGQSMVIYFIMISMFLFSTLNETVEHIFHIFNENLKYSCLVYKNKIQICSYTSKQSFTCETLKYLQLKKVMRYYKGIVERRLFVMIIIDMFHILNFSHGALTRIVGQVEVPRHLIWMKLIGHFVSTVNHSV